MSMDNAFAKKNAGLLSTLNSASLWVILLLNKAMMNGDMEFLKDNWEDEDPTDFLVVSLNAQRAHSYCSRLQLPFDHVELVQSLTRAKQEILEMLNHNNLKK
jgi:hypothetical protein